ncbi:hypothetical protein [Blastococcus sp. SYSU D01042]
MIVAAGLLVLVGLGLFVAGVLTGVTALYWACVGACVVAAVLLFLARRRMTAATTTASPVAPTVAAPAAAGVSTSGGRHAGGSTAATATTAATVAVSGNGAAPPAAEPEVGTATADPGPAAAPPAAPAAAPAVPAEAGEPPVEEVEVTDLLLVVDLKDEVLVVDEHPRYHVAGCAHLAGRDTFPLPVDEARTDGFTPCGVCRPDATLAGRVRERRAAGGA